MTGVDSAITPVEVLAAHFDLYDPVHGWMLGLYEVFVFTRRPLWFLIFGGVFDRHPDLKVVVTENGVQWLPSLVRDMFEHFVHEYAIKSTVRERQRATIKRGVLGVREITALRLQNT